MIAQHQLLVAGVGNMLNSDDAFGPLVIQGYEQKHRLQPGLKLMETGIGGINIIQEMLLGYKGLILVDAFEERLPPGTLRVLEPVVEDLALN
ncbi:MAG: hydrogenase maturation protease, partial [Deltaproteobacteria bacterium]